MRDTGTGIPGLCDLDRLGLSLGGGGGGEGGGGGPDRYDVIQVAKCQRKISASDVSMREIPMTAVVNSLMLD